MRVQVRAQHTTSRLQVDNGEGAAPTYVRVISPARAGDAHLVDEAGQSLCGQDASQWKAITSQPWGSLGPLRCASCQREAVLLRNSGT